MHSATDPVSGIEYPRSILAGMAELLDGFEARLPRVPDSCTWEGRAKTQYAIELVKLRDDLAFLRYLLEATLEQLTGAGSGG